MFYCRLFRKPAIRCDCLLSSRRAVGHLPLSRAADGAPCSLRGKHGLVVLVQHVLVPVEVGEIPFYSRMRQIPCESCWKARCLSWTGSAGSLSAGLSSPVGSRRPGRGAGRAAGSRERKARRASSTGHGSDLREAGKYRRQGCWGNKTGVVVPWQKGPTLVHFLAVLGQELETVSCDKLSLKRSVPRNSFVQLRWIMCLSTSPVQKCARDSP